MVMSDSEACLVVMKVQSEFWNEGQVNVIVVENSLEEELCTSESVQ